MGRPRQAPNAAEFDKACEKLWQWLVKNAGAWQWLVENKIVQGNAPEYRDVPQGPRRHVISKLMHAGQISAQRQTKRAAAAAAALLNLEQATMDRTTAKEHLALRAAALDNATQAELLIKKLMTASLFLSFQAERPLDDLAAATAKLPDALAAIEDYHRIVEGLGGNVWGSNWLPDMPDLVGRVAVDLADGGFSAREVGVFLDDTKDDEELKAGRWQKRIKRAREQPADNEGGAPLSVATRGRKPVPKEHARQPPVRTGPSPSRGPRRK